MDFFESSPTFDDPLGMLKACHRRIERALDTAARVARLEAEGPLDDRAREVLRQTLHYFRVGVPRHAADEEESLFPRMRQVVEAIRSEESLRRIEEEHRRLETAHQELDALGERLSVEGRFRADDERRRFSHLVAELTQVYTEHIRVEDEELFPAARQAVSADRLAEVGAEMAARRGIDFAEHQKRVTGLRGRPWQRRLEDRLL